MRASESVCKPVLVQNQRGEQTDISDYHPREKLNELWAVEKWEIELERLFKGGTTEIKPAPRNALDEKIMPFDVSIIYYVMAPASLFRLPKRVFLDLFLKDHYESKYTNIYILHFFRHRRLVFTSFRKDYRNKSREHTNGILVKQAY